MRFTVMASDVEKLRKKVQRIANKGVAVTFEVIGRNDFKSKMHAGLYYEAYEVEVEGLYRIDGWEFVGTIQHLENGNVIRTISDRFEGRIPERYRSCAPYCEHCKTHRYRKDTYLVHNVETDEYKMVGKQCLMDYTNGLDANVCASFMDVVNFCERDFTECDDFEFDDICSMGSNFGEDNFSVKSVAYEFVSKQGYTGNGGTAYKMAALLFNKMQHRSTWNIESHREDVENVDEWVHALEANSDYLRNAKTLWESEDCYFYRDFSLIASLINVYLKEKSQEAARKLHADIVSKSEHVGKVGERIEFVAKSVRPLYTKSGSYSYYNSYESTVYELIDENGNVIIWSTSNVVEENDRIIATIVSHGEYRGVKQTKVSRGKILR